MTYRSVSEHAEQSGLIVMGALHPDEVNAKGLSGGTLILLGAGPDFWPAFSASPEANDTARNPVDRWSERVVGGMARAFGAVAHFPFGGPPYAPFIDWALKSGRAFLSPTGMMVHDTVGLMISYRGALHFSEPLDIPTRTGLSPCPDCPDQPCLSACPVNALGGDPLYDLGLCHSHLDSPAGTDCMMKGCAARRACPISKGAGRLDAQSALHMRAFHPS